jgi:hypothetical protein
MSERLILASMRDCSFPLLAKVHACHAGGAVSQSSCGKRLALRQVFYFLS